MKEDEKIDKPYTINEEVIEGKDLTVLRTPNGSPILGLERDYTEDQIEELYNVSIGFFERGRAFGIVQNQKAIRQALGFKETPKEESVTDDSDVADKPEV